MKEFELRGPAEESGDTATAKANDMLDNGEQQAESVVTPGLTPVRNLQDVPVAWPGESTA